MFELLNKPLGEMDGKKHTRIVVYEPRTFDHFPETDAVQRYAGMRETGEESALSYAEMIPILPDVLSDASVLKAISKRLDLKDLPNSIHTVPLQSGMYAVHMFALYDWGNGIYFPAVHYIPRGHRDTAFGEQAYIDSELLPQLSEAIRGYGDRVQSHTSVIDVVTTSLIPTIHGDIPTYTTILDTTRGEITVRPERVRMRDGSHKNEIIPVVSYSLFENQQMTMAVYMQTMLAKGLRRRTQDTCIAEVKKQLSRVAESLAVIAQTSGILPKNFSIDAGDFMGVLNAYKDPSGEVGMPVVERLNLMTVKGGAQTIHSESDWLEHSMSYTDTHDSRTYPVFALLGDDGLGVAWDSAKELIRQSL